MGSLLMPGRLIKPPNIVHLTPPKGLMKREQRLYFLHSIACQPNPDQERAKRLLDKMLEPTCGKCVD